VLTIGYTEVHVMYFERERIRRINFDKLNEEQILDTLREYVREKGEKILAVSNEKNIEFEELLNLGYFTYYLYSFLVLEKLLKCLKKGGT
jgi:hypothetical protein